MTTQILLFVAAATSCATLLALLILLPRTGRGVAGLAGEVRGDLRAGRDESRLAARELRDEIAENSRAVADTLQQKLEEGAARQLGQLEGMSGQLKAIAEANAAATEGIRATLDGRVQALQEGNEAKLEAIRREVSDGLQASFEAVTAALDRLSTAQQAVLSQLHEQIQGLTESNQTTLERIRTALNERVKDLQDVNERSREAQSTGLQQAALRQSAQLETMTTQLRGMSDTNREALDAIRTAFDVRVKELQQSNEGKLDEMRRVVEEKLQDTLEKRLGESFKIVSERLEAVHQGLGEMQTLASGVGDLKRVLTNVKTRGTWAEYQLGGILEQILTPQQYAKNVAVKEASLDRVEYAVRLPAPKGEPTRWLPIDSKFLNEDYQRLQAAAEAGDQAAVQAAVDALARALRLAARDIHDKYVCPPETADYGIMFLATEGLYAEALRHPGLVDELQQRYRVVIAGPTTFAAILSSLCMSFQSLAVQERATEVWRVLGAVKTEFGKFGGVLEKVQRQLQTASRTIDETRTRTSVMERRLRSVQQLEAGESARILTLPTASARLTDESEDTDGTTRLEPDAPLGPSATANEPF
jgi:DNA recombination protein RmuC